MRNKRAINSGRRKMKKKWYHSKTVWVNGLVAIAILVQAIIGQAWLNAELQGAIIVVANVVLRLFTHSGLQK
ncbi:MAG: hypothetical protein IIB05_07080 [Bacteroidetes bacterium]|nr:hypothetical protein [Bacteroidota bacterium]